MRRLEFWRVVVMLVPATLATACNLFTEITRHPFTAECAGEPAIRHTGTIAAETWSPAAGLHMVVDTLTVTDSLRIEAGTEVCTAPGAVLKLSDSSAVAAVGTAELPIRIHPADTGQPDFYVIGLNMVGLTHVDAASTSISLGDYSGIQIDSSQVGPVSAGAFANVAAIGSLLGGASVGSYSHMSLTNTIVHGGPVACGYRTGVTLTGVRIEASPTAALQAYDDGGKACEIGFAGIRLVDNAAIGSLTGSGAASLLSQPGIEDSLRGNLGDSLRVTVGGEGFGAAPPSEAVIPGYLHLMGYGLPFGPEGTLRVQPGARLSLREWDGLGALWVHARVVARGTAAAPIILEKEMPFNHYLPYFSVLGSAANPSVLTHVLVEGWGVSGDSGHTLLVDSSRFKAAFGVILRSPGSRITASLVEDATDSAAVVLGADGVELRRTVVLHSAGRSKYPLAATNGTGVRIEASNVVVDSCEISGSTGDGIVVASGSGVRISHCNLAGNAGAGLNNLSGAVVDARDNWWGDPAGPTAPGAARVLGNVLYTPWATTPFAVGPAVASVSLTPSAGTVSTADTIRFQAVIRDSSGAVAPSALLWQVADTSVAVLDPQWPGLLVGVAPGTTTLRVSPVSQPATAAVATVTVTPGAPALRWTQEALPPGVWRTIWGSSPSDIYVGGSGILHFDGTSWTAVQPDSGQIELLWGRTATDVYATRGWYLDGFRLELLHYDGNEWRSLGNVSNHAVEGIWADSAGEIFLGADSLRHYVPGQGWSAAAGAGCPLWGRSARDVYAACNGGVWRFDGTSWSAIGGMPQPEGIWGTEKALFVVGVGGQIQRYDDQGWTEVPSVTACLSRIAGTADGRMYAEGCGVVYIDGTRSWPVWTGVVTGGGIYSLSVVGDEVYLLYDMETLAHGRPR